jgi:hypothetical protein
MQFLLSTPSRAVERYIRPHLLRSRVEHVAGPERVEYGPEEVLAICVVRNGEMHIRSFIDHHFRLGVRHIVFLDNGSSDATVRIASGYDNVTVLRTDCPYQKYENVMKRYLARRFSPGRWNLCVDIDERFDYPFSDRLDLTSLIAYLNRRSFTAVVAQMLDLFPDARLSGLAEAEWARSMEAQRYYDVSAVRTTPYPYGTLPNLDPGMHWGGIRKTLFGTDNGLTKAALVFVDDTIELFVHWHHVRNARVADFSCVLLHFPFVGGFADKVAEAVDSGRYGRVTTHEYAMYHKGLSQHPDLPIRGPAAREFTGVDALLDEGFLVTSSAYHAWVAARGVTTGIDRACRSP